MLPESARILCSLGLMAIAISGCGNAGNAESTEKFLGNSESPVTMNGESTGSQANDSTRSMDLSHATAKALEDQLACIRPPEPGIAIRAMIKNGFLKETDYGADGIPVFGLAKPMTVYGKKVTFVAGWQAETDGSVKEPFWRGPGTAPPLHIAVSVDAKPSEIANKALSIEAGSLDLSDNGSTISCYGE